MKTLYLMVQDYLHQINLADAHRRLAENAEAAAIMMRPAILRAINHSAEIPDTIHHTDLTTLVLDRDDDNKAIDFGVESASTTLDFSIPSPECGCPLCADADAERVGRRIDAEFQAPTNGAASQGPTPPGAFGDLPCDFDKLKSSDYFTGEVVLRYVGGTGFFYFAYTGTDDMPRATNAEAGARQWDSLAILKQWFANQSGVVRSRIKAIGYRPAPVNAAPAVAMDDAVDDVC